MARIIYGHRPNPRRVLKRYVEAMIKLVDEGLAEQLQVDLAELRLELRDEIRGVKELLKAKENSAPALALRVAKLERELANLRRGATHALDALKEKT